MGYIYGCIAVVLFTVAYFGTVLCEMAYLLKFSNKKQVDTKRIPLYFPRNYSHSIELDYKTEDKGPYVPVFVLSIIAYFLGLLLLIVQTALYFGVKNEEITNVAALICTGITIIQMVFGVVLDVIYAKKYKVPNRNTTNALRK